MAYTRNSLGGWDYWTSSPNLAAQASYTQAVWTTPAVPSGATAVSFGLNIAAVGSLTTDDYAMSDAGVAPPPVTSALTDNPSLEISANNSVPDCYQFGSSGTNTATWTRTNDAHTGSFGESVQIAAYTSGDRKLVTKQDTGTCSPAVTAGHNYAISTWYKSNAPVRFVVFYRNSAGTWTYTTTGPLLPAASVWTKATLNVTAPSTAVAMSFGLALSQVGNLTIDDYAASDLTTPPPAQPAAAAPAASGD